MLVQPLAGAGVGEALIGYDDTAVRLAPVDHATAREMIAEVRGSTVLAGIAAYLPVTSTRSATPSSRCRG